MARSTVTVNDKALLDMIRRTTGPSAIKRIEERLRTEAEAIAETARERFPVSRWASGAIKDKDHAKDSISVEGRITEKAISYSVVSDSDYVYFIRTRQIDESAAERRDRFTRRKGESDEDYAARVTVGRKLHAWTALVVRPGKLRSKAIANELTADLISLAEGR